MIKFITHNNILLQYDGAEGIKTGFTSVAGYNELVPPVKIMKRIISIVMGCKTLEARDNLNKEIVG